jgi:hypothetical protein
VEELFVTDVVTNYVGGLQENTPQGLKPILLLRRGRAKAEALAYLEARATARTKRGYLGGGSAAARAWLRARRLARICWVVRA